MHLRSLALLVFWTLPDGAAAGAWTRAESETLVIFSTERKAYPLGALVTAEADIRSNATQIYVEHGLTSGTTLGVKIRGDFSETDEDVELKLGGFVRHRVWQGSAGDVLSVEAGISVPIEALLFDDTLAAPDSVMDGFASLQYGRGWQWAMGDSFVSTGAGFLMRGGDEANELRAGLTVGHTPMRPLLGLLDLAVEVPMSGDEDAALIVSPSVAWTFYPWLAANDRKPIDAPTPTTLQVGGRVDALKPEDGIALFFGVWHRF